MKRIPRERLDAEIHMHQLAQPEPDPQLGGPEHRRGFLRAVRQVRNPGVGRVLPAQSAATGPIPPISTPTSPTCATRFCASAIILRSRCGARATRAIRRRRSTRRCARCSPRSSPRGATSRARPTAPACAPHGPYFWRAPREFYTVTDDYFKTETGSMIVPTLESIHGMMPKKDWETINDDWAAHDLAKGNQHGDLYPRHPRRALRQDRQPRRLCAQGADWRTTRPSAPCTRAATRSSSIPPRPSSPG